MAECMGTSQVLELRAVKKILDFTFTFLFAFLWIELLCLGLPESLDGAVQSLYK